MSFLRARIVIPIVVATAATVGGVAVATAQGDKSGPGAQATGSVPGYYYTASAPIPIGANQQRFGSVLCPNGWPVTGGGAFGAGGVGENINSSYPIDGADVDTVSDDGWGVYMNNAPGYSATSFTVWAICRIPSP